MYIKSIKICNFRSYHDVTTPSEFSPHHNAVVGRNGSGKTNFFDAIRFVLLADKFKTLGKSDRTELLHEGRGVQEAQAGLRSSPGVGYDPMRASKKSRAHDPMCEA